ncbi:hypothetical protein GCM10010885_21660 [Alicyclobacillus cellulosilyticus]|uniref:HTH gntR-type domain-containing protein n=1 Tax=Alicyclobacillus cellulosilyticus TaxID=1003997 RepID=A0A917KGZ1_9BACL|nr:GntR family transcriptional regulator [Alicyclobacillus cellulosilyticus]GGJ11956.1 hypothetical protein GCM10010885_21660 [Alicyclobacillus cellulosilyticus]
MLLYLQPDSDKPLYQQIRDQIVTGLATGQLFVGESLPPIRQLAVDFGIHYHTVHKAYDQLRQEGLIRLNRRTGAVIWCDPPPPGFAAQWREQVRVLLAEAWVKGMSPDDILATCADIVRSFQPVGGLRSGAEAGSKQAAGNAAHGGRGGSRPPGRVRLDDEGGES